MRPASQVFYLAIFALFGPAHSLTEATTSRSSSPNVCAIEPNAIVSDACASYDTLDSLNQALTPSLKAITQTTDFFGYYRLNLFDQVCPFWNDANSMCGNIACAVNTIEDEKDIPETWRVKELSKLEGPKAEHPGRKQQKERGVERPLQGNLGEGVGESCVVEYDDECDDRDYCVPEDESASAKGDYVSLLDNPERYTGYRGESAHMVWDNIYKENCFSMPTPLAPGKQIAPTGFFQASNDLRSVLQANAPAEAFDPDETCLEKRVFYRVISGMHASISTHICNDYLNQTTGTWGPNLQCYRDRLAAHPDRISNLYFNYALVLRAVAKLRTHLSSYTFCSGDPRQDADTKAKVSRLVDQAASGPTIFDETTMFQDPYVAGAMKEDFRQRFRNVSRLMDCVGCDKCRLWGKLQTVGYGTALKVLFEFDENSPLPLKRTELVALVNTLDRIATSLDALEKFRATDDSTTTISTPALSTPITNTPSEPAHFNPPPSPNLKPSALSSPSEEEEDEEPPAHSALLALQQELALIYRAFIFIVKSYIRFPSVMLRIVIFEFARIWNFWLGLRVPERDYDLKIPSREEL